MWRFNDEISEKASFHKWEELQGVDLTLTLELLSS